MQKTFCCSQVGWYRTYSELKLIPERVRKWRIRCRAKAAAFYILKFWPLVSFKWALKIRYTSDMQLKKKKKSRLSITYGRASYGNTSSLLREQSRLSIGPASSLSISSRVSSFPISNFSAFVLWENFILDVSLRGIQSPAVWWWLSAFSILSNKNKEESSINFHKKQNITIIKTSAMNPACSSWEDSLIS